MGPFLLSIATPETLSKIGFILLALGLLGEVAILLIPTERHLLHNLLGLGFAAVVVVGYLVGHIGDDEAFRVVSERAANAEADLRKIEGPRDITASEHASLVSCLREAPSKGVVHVRPGFIQGDAPQIADQIKKVFEEAGGWEIVSAPAGDVLSWSTPGIFLVVNDLHRAPQHATEIQKCFWKAGRKILGYADPKHASDTVTIGIGSKL